MVHQAIDIRRAHDVVVQGGPPSCTTRPGQDTSGSARQCPTLRDLAANGRGPRGSIAAIEAQDGVVPDGPDNLGEDAEGSDRQRPQVPLLLLQQGLDLSAAQPWMRLEAHSPPSASKTRSGLPACTADAVRGPSPW